MGFRHHLIRSSEKNFPMREVGPFIPLLERKISYHRGKNFYGRNKGHFIYYEMDFFSLIQKKKRRNIPLSTTPRLVEKKGTSMSRFFNPSTRKKKGRSRPISSMEGKREEGKRKPTLHRQRKEKTTKKRLLALGAGLKKKRRALASI